MQKKGKGWLYESNAPTKKESYKLHEDLLVAPSMTSAIKKSEPNE